jgi:hypothetical protein
MDGSQGWYAAYQVDSLRVIANAATKRDGQVAFRGTPVYRVGRGRRVIMEIPANFEIERQPAGMAHEDA